MYRDAVEHFLVALDFQRSASVSGRQEGAMSESIWSTLRMALIYLNEGTLMDHAREKDLDTLLRHFNINKVQ